jgi:hypothetical protein
MPVFDFRHWTKASGDTLEETGPLVQVVLGMPQALEEWCVKNGFPVPAPVQGYALIDTGASSTAVDEKIISGLNIIPIDSIPTSTPTGHGRSFVYPAKVSFPGLNLGDVRMDRVIGCELNWQCADGREVIMLLGRDILKHFLMIYNGPGSSISLAY